MSARTPDPVHRHAAEPWGGWRWRESRHGEHFRRCSYCGSMHPDDVTAELAVGVAPEWADWKYGWPHKFYLTVPNRNPSEVFCVGASHGGDPDRDPGPGYVHASQLTNEQRAVAMGDGMLSESDPTHGAHWYRFGHRDTHGAKFYTAHLADPALSEPTRTAIERASGLRLSFEGGLIRWEPLS